MKTLILPYSLISSWRLGPSFQSWIVMNVCLDALIILFLVLSSMTWHFYFWPCHLWIYSHNSGLVSYDLSLLILVLSAKTYPCHLWTANHKLSFCFLVLSLRLDFHILNSNWANTTWLTYRTSDLVITYWCSQFWSSLFLFINSSFELYCTVCASVIP